MFQKATIILEPQGERIPTSNWAYPLYAELLKKIDPELTEQFHDQGYTPLSHYLAFDKQENKWKWHITLFDEGLEPVLAEITKLQSLKVERYDTEMLVKEMVISKNISESEFCAKFYQEATIPNQVTLNFVVPTSFKSNNNYVNLPTKELILQSCINRFNAYAKEYNVADPDALQSLIDSSWIYEYQLKSCVFKIKGINISSFRGSLTLKIKGPDLLQRLFVMILSFGEVAGIGIKTALGMGGVEIDRL
jgi:CRISPR-associated endoribonuclease Cas6